MGLQGSYALAPWLHACSPGSACSGIIRYDPWPLRFLLPRRPCHQSPLRPAGRYPKDFLAVLSGGQTSALTPRRPRRPLHRHPELRTSRTSLMSVREQYMSASGAVSSGECYPPFAARRSLRLFGSWNCCPTNSRQRYPPFSRPFIRSSRRKPGSRAACSGACNPGSRLSSG